MAAGVSTESGDRRITVASLRRSVIVSILFTLFGGPGIVLVYLPLAITRFRVPADEPQWHRPVAWALIAVGLVPLLESIVRFVRVGRGTLMPNVPTERLVATGLYRYVRNPMYVGVVVVLIGETVLFWSVDMVLYTFVVWLASDLFIRLYEEPVLRKRHGEEYLRYCARVRRWWPRLIGQNGNANVPRLLINTLFRMVRLGARRAKSVDWMRVPQHLNPGIWVVERHRGTAP